MPGGFSKVRCAGCWRLQNMCKRMRLSGLPGAASFNDYLTAGLT